ncbi:MAG: ABC transporter ATP-binding protein [Bacteroidales bacterium]|jgi:ABC-type multidrug transport system ATPase subunit|nr:ABC transporter ATP-binding protein [Bacteroidales bacterium]
MNAIEAYNITHRYGSVTALEDISFSVGEGELFGFIGPDGAGKTTLFRIAATLIIPAGGRMTIFGLNVVSRFRDLRNQIGYMPGRFSLYHDLTVQENLNFYATIFGTTIKENYHLIEPIYRQIEPFKKRQAGRLSGGMKQKLALSCALIHKPRILILDEPTTGVDAVSRTEFWEMLTSLKKEGITIIVSTPYMDEALRCDRIALIQGGRLMGIDTPEGIRSSYKSKLYAVSHHDRYRLLIALREIPQVVSPEPFGESVHISLRDGADPAGVIKLLEEAGLRGVTIAETVPGIEDVFLELMQKNQ